MRTTNNRVHPHRPAAKIECLPLPDARDPWEPCQRAVEGADGKVRRFPGLLDDQAVGKAE